MEKLCRYLHIPSQVFWSRSIFYTKEEEKKIRSFFLRKYQDVALKETEKYISKLISWLCSNVTPTNVKRSGSLQQLLTLRQLLQDLSKHLDSFSKGDWRYIGYQLAGRFQKIYPNIAFGEFKEMVLSLDLISKEIIPANSLRSGRRNEAYFDAVANLYTVFEKYAEKKPTRKNIQYEVNYDLFNRRQKECGEFLGYLKASILPAIPRKNKTALPVASLTYIARQVIESMAKTSPK